MATQVTNPGDWKKYKTLVKNHEIYAVVKTASGKKNIYGLTSPQEGSTWSGTIPVPARGDYVFVTMNNVGHGMVRGYFIEQGPDKCYLGIYVEPDFPPEWWLDQNDRDPDGPRQCCMAFGSEVIKREILYIAKFKNVPGKYLVSGDTGPGYQGQKILDARQEKFGNKPDSPSGFYLDEKSRMFSASEVESIERLESVIQRRKKNNAKSKKAEATQAATAKTS